MAGRPLVLFALAREAAPFLESCRVRGVLVQRSSRLRARVRTAAGALDVGVFGAGAAHAAAALDGEEPTAVIHAGLGGGLSPRLAPGDVVRAVSVRRGGDVLECGPAHAGLAGLAAVRFVTSDAPVDVAGKRSLHEADAGDVVEMESFPVARECAERGIPWTGVRVVGDGLADGIPRAVLDAWDGRRFRVGPIVRRAIFSRGLRRELGALRRDADAAARRLARVLADALC